MDHLNIKDMSKTELIEALERFRHREILFNATEAVAHIGHYEWDYEKDCLRSCSEEYANLFGTTVEEMMAAESSREKTLEQIHPDDRESFLKNIETLDKADSYDLKYRIIRRDGEIRHIQEFGVVNANKSNASPGSYGIIQDITELTKHERDLEYRDALTQQAEEITELGYFNFDLDTEKYNFISEGFARIHGVSRDAYLQSINSRDDDMSDVHPDDYQRLAAEYRNHQKAGSQINIDYRIFRADGEVRWIREIGKIIYSADSRKPQSVGVLQDITKQKKYQQDLEHRDVLAQQAESITDIGHYIFDEKSEKYLYLSTGFARILGCSVEQYIARIQSVEDDLADIHEDDRERVREKYKQYKCTHEDCVMEYRLLRTDGEVRWIRELGTAHKVENDQILKTLGVVQDITAQKMVETKMLESQAMLEQKVAERTRELADTIERLQEEISEREKIAAELKHLADHDALTGLPSLRLCKDRLERSLIESRRSQQMTAVLFVDLDGFKAVNDTYGHEYGDIVLKVTADRIKAEIRETDTVARIGGDEFIVIMSRLPDSGIVQRIASNLIEQISQLIQLNQKEVRVGASLGIALYPEDGTTAEELIRQADRAMYHVKNSGKSNFSFSQPQKLN